MGNARDVAWNIYEWLSRSERARLRDLSTSALHDEFSYVRFQCGAQMMDNVMEALYELLNFEQPASIEAGYENNSMWGAF